MNSGIILKDTQLKKREGFILECIENDHIGRGEIAPLPSFSVESLADALAQTKKVAARWLNYQSIDWETLFASVAWGFSLALADLSHLFSDAVKPAQIAPLVGLFSGQEKSQIENASSEVFKVKLGRYAPFQEAKKLYELFSPMPNLKLRLDANQAWSLAQARMFFSSLPTDFYTQIDFIEEPCHTPTLSLAISHECGVGIAWDESLRLIPTLSYLCDPYVKALILKPMLMGDIARVRSWVEKARSNKKQAIISSSLESSFGLIHLVKIAQHMKIETPLGIDTAGLFSAELIAPLTYPFIDKVIDKERSIITLEECECVYVMGH